MNETINNIMNRRSTRGYTSEVPTQSQLQTLVDAGLRAPSAMNKQSNHITVITDKAVIDELNSGVVANMDEDAKARMRDRTGKEDISVFYDAPCVMLISSDFALEPYSKLDVGIAISNICTVAESLGLNSCIIGMVAMFLNTDDSTAFVSKLALPSGQKPVIGIAIGHGNVDMPTPPVNDGRANFIG